MPDVEAAECNHCGRLFASDDDLVEFDIRTRRAYDPFALRSRTVYLCPDAREEVDGTVAEGIEYLGMNDGTVVGASISVAGNRPEATCVWHDRGDDMIGYCEPLFRYVESEIVPSSFHPSESSPVATR